MGRIKRAAARFLGRGHSEKVREANASHDMASDPDEAYYRRQYLHWILPELEKSSAGRSARIVDLACGHGRLAIPLAEWARTGQVTGVDFNPPAVKAAQKYAGAAGLNNVTFIESDLVEFARNLAPASLDAAVCVEALYNVPEYKEALKAVLKALKPGGLLAASFRSQWYDLLKSVRSRDFISARLVAENREGHWGDGAVWSSWHRAAEVKELLSATGFEPLRAVAIGPLSGIAGDPLAALARPSELPGGEADRLFALELNCAEAYADQGRYILALARKPS